MYSKKREADMYQHSRDLIHPTMPVNGQTSLAPPTYEQAIQNPYGNTQKTSKSTSTLSTNPESSSSSISSSSGQEPTQESADDEILSRALEFTHHVPPPLSSIQRLHLPIAIPQSQPGFTASYARLFAPSLTITHGINEADFLAFIDNLNLVSSPAIPLQAVDAVGGIIAMVPHHLFGAIGAGVQATAKMGGAALSAGRVKLYMQKANEDFFNPRLLRVRVVDAAELAEVLNLPYSVPGIAAVTPESMTQSSLERRVAAVRPYMTDVTFDVLPPIQQTDFLKKMSAKQVVMRENKAERKFMRQREKVVRKEARGRGKKKEDKETKAARKVKWLLIDNL